MFACKIPGSQLYRNERKTELPKWPDFGHHEPQQCPWTRSLLDQTLHRASSSTAFFYHYQGRLIPAAHEQLRSEDLHSFVALTPVYLNTLVMA